MIGDLLRAFAIQSSGDATFFLPEQASTTAGHVDWLFNVVTWISIFFFALITLLLVLFVIKYRDRPGHKEEKTATHNQPLEITWTVIPLLIVIWIFWEGFTGYLNLATPPQNAYEIQVTGQKWNWLFTYPNGVVDGQLHVPVDTDVRLVMSSQDVLHSFYIPAFRVKKDVVPGRYTDLWFHAYKEGEFDVFCTEYCGTNHSTMLSKVVVHPPGQFEKWLEDAGNFLAKLPPAEAGEKLYLQRGCKQCHSVDGKSGIGPTFKNLYGEPQALRSGETVVADENYIRTSILNPQAQIVAGYEPVMPTYQGRLKDAEISAIIEYLKTLK
jgi:cytochrome c oxidase subunit 2